MDNDVSNQSNENIAKLIQDALTFQWEHQTGRKLKWRKKEDAEKVADTKEETA